MRTVVHLSDLHFGRVDEALLTPLVERVHAIAPDVVVVSGDLTQRARSHEFEQAREFLERLPGPRIVVPGNHDVPLYNVLDRFLRPLSKFRRIIEPDLSPCHIDQEIAVLGVNTARSFVIKDGRINEEQIAQLRETLSTLPRHVVKLVVTHHPFDVHAGGDEDDVIGRATKAMQMFAHCRVDVLLAGHVHVSHSADSGERYAMAGYEALIVSAGTATSTRARGESNSFNVLRIQDPRVEVQRFEWQPARASFEPADRHVYERSDAGWRVAAGMAA
jgi:3',5'-cyclic AMP phosphodiesterase CpdA